MEKAAAVNALTEMLGVPESIVALRAEVAELKGMIKALHAAMPPALITIQEAALKLGFNERSIRRMLAEGRLRSIRVGNRIRIDLGSVQEALMLRGTDLMST